MKQHLGRVDGEAGIRRRTTLDDLAEEKLPRTGWMLHLQGYVDAIARRAW